MMKYKLIVVVLSVFFMITLWLTAKPQMAQYYQSHPILDEIRRRFALISPKFGNIPIKTGSESYTINKSMITLCIVNPDTGEIYDMNTLTYVALHELSHCITKADGKDSHEDEFKQNFAMLLRRAAQLGFYNPQKSIPHTYCGLKS